MEKVSRKRKGGNMSKVGPWKRSWINIGQIDARDGEDPVRIRLISYDPMRGIIDIHIPKEDFAALLTNQRRTECSYRFTGLEKE